MVKRPGIDSVLDFLDDQDRRRVRGGGDSEERTIRIVPVDRASRVFGTSAHAV